MISFSCAPTLADLKLHWTQICPFCDRTPFFLNLQSRDYACQNTENDQSETHQHRPLFQNPTKACFELCRRAVDEGAGRVPRRPLGWGRAEMLTELFSRGGGGLLGPLPQGDHPAADREGQDWVGTAPFPSASASSWIERLKRSPTRRRRGAAEGAGAPALFPHSSCLRQSPQLPGAPIGDRRRRTPVGN